MSDILNSPKDFDLDYSTLHTNTLLEQLNILRSEINVLRAQNNTLRVEKQKMEKALDDFKNNPAIIGVVSEVFENGKAIVRGYNGVVFYIQIPNKFIGKIKPEDRLALAQNNLAILEVISAEKDYRASALELTSKPQVDFKQVGGLKDVILEIDETVSLPLTKPELFTKFGIDSPKAVLLYGPPGTGKTMLAKAVAQKANATFISLSGSELIHKFIGEGAKIVKDLFTIAREKAPSIIFIDEIDAVASYRMDISNGADREVHRTMMQLLVEMDGFRNNELVKVIGATNRIDILDEAILRPGRFDRIIKVPLPNEQGRTEIFKIHTKNVPLSKNIKINELAKLTEGTSGAQIESICREAAIFAIRSEKKVVELQDFKDAIAKVIKQNEEDVIDGRMFH